MDPYPFLGNSWIYHALATASQLIVQLVLCGSRELYVDYFSSLLFVANFSEEVVANLPEDLANGVYYGFASVSGGPVYAMVMSVGWNPTYNNEKRSMVSECVYVRSKCTQSAPLIRYMCLHVLHTDVVTEKVM